MSEKFEEVTIRPDGVHELSLHRFREIETVENATVEILECEDCGEVSIGWYRNEVTKDE